MKKKICFATNNANKLKEIRLALPHIEIVSLQDIGCNEVLPETQETLQGNSLQKAQFVYDKFGVDCFADDTGLEIESLGGEPGVYSARYAGPNCDADDNMEKVLLNLSGKVNRAAQFKTVITLIENGTPTFFEGDVQGSIREEKVGVAGFGYDPIFEPISYDITFAEMSMEEKNKISHRGIAVRNMIVYLSKK